jgi:hypothetical protein
MQNDLTKWLRLVEADAARKQITEGTIERMPYKDYMGNALDLTLIHDPTAQQARHFIDRSANKRLRVMVVDHGIICWDAYYVEHADMAKLFGKSGAGRDDKLWLMHDDDHGQLPEPVYRFGGGSWKGLRDRYVKIAAIARLLTAGFHEPL